MSVVLLGPVNNLGHPFEHTSELVKVYEIGNHKVYGFGDRWLRDGPPMIPAEPIEACIVWDPMWLDPKQLHSLVDRTAPWGIPRVGLFGDWFAGWDPRGGYPHAGVRGSAMLFDGIVADEPGVMAMEARSYPQNMVVCNHMLTYGRLFSLGDDVNEVRNILDYFPQSKRPIDVSFVGYNHVAHVPLRLWWLHHLHRICCKHGWSYVKEEDVNGSRMEHIMLRSKVTFNHSLGTQLNCRVYEAAATGSVLVTDGHNVSSDSIRDFASIYWRPDDLEHQLKILLDDEYGASKRTVQAVKGIDFAVRHNPTDTWSNLIDTAMTVARPIERKALELKTLHELNEQDRAYNAYPDATDTIDLDSRAHLSDPA